MTTIEKYSIFEQLAYSTIRIECDVSDGKVSSGTGFFVKFNDKGSTYTPVIITNKHVVEASSTGRLLFTIEKENHEPDIGNNFLWEITNFEKSWIPHPDPSIDLCAMPFGSLATEAKDQGKKFFLTFLSLDLLPTESDIEDFIGMEKIIMVGYPNGIWDKTNNFPIFRSGVSATHYRYDWNGRPEFLIDIACFPGSSGSPIMICDIGQVVSRQGINIGGYRTKLLGILSRGFQHRVDGQLEIAPIPTGNQIVSVSSVPNNLGVVIKAKMLNQFEDFFKAASGT